MIRADQIYNDRYELYMYWYLLGLQCKGTQIYTELKGEHVFAMLALSNIIG